MSDNSIQFSQGETSIIYVYSWLRDYSDSIYQNHNYDLELHELEQRETIALVSDLNQLRRNNNQQNLTSAEVLEATNLYKRYCIDNANRRSIRKHAIEVEIENEKAVNAMINNNSNNSGLSIGNSNLVIVVDKPPIVKKEVVVRPEDPYYIEVEDD
jgi:hypothetical protein